MPSEHSPGQSGDRQRFPDLAEDIGEDPARFLNRDLFEHGQVRLEERDHSEFNEGNQRVVRDEAVSAPGEMIRDRIQGIDDLAVARAWRAIELRLERTPEGGRGVVVGFLEDRIDKLEADGERDLPGLSPEEQRERAVEAYEAVAPKEEAVFLDENGEQQTSVSASQKLAAITDGGEQE
ncbi:hypothetical protein [Halolamina sp.]|uniref:hypothetical protein n=1 Tax=Halolamina sp. TaxID=1940283 RepID=UPI00356A0C0E